ncbi:siderophore ABC transporter substrate-binding protein [Agromyces aerolatus]|uniref:siderophore ABC transporter substrate-binding protein n=1 Tax=Agromyces sp. LY-1074 TaxID=3074080 RepID=UPI00285D7B04|nr:MULTISPECIES: ABC transporter substrate-binding protein [unclassified Agromyces]MDR5700869.1 ABC transporter substrate-binding protein [Agromyces sp. LY-1074]MDR5707470.1 ABC transporter substrate-binding protein [Agromyces sp. LY-1358]
MPRRRHVMALAALAAVSLALTGCAASAGESEETGAATAEAGTITIEDNHGEVEVPVNPERVVALDNHVFETLSAWDVPLVAAPKQIMGTIWPEYTDDDAVLDAGAHFEPKLESIVAAQPDLIIAGYRFAESYDAIVEQNPEAAVIEIAPREGEDPGGELIRQIEILGQIFDREDDAADLAAAFEAAIDDAKAAYDGESTVTTLLTSGGEIAYVAPVTGRSLGVLYPTLDLVPAIEQAAEDTSHGDDISVEAIAAANPDWLIVMDRDGALTNAEGYVPAKELIEGSEALANVPAVKDGQIVYVDPDFYLTEDIQSYTALYEQIAEAFGA